MTHCIRRYTGFFKLNALSPNMGGYNVHILVCLFLFAASVNSFSSDVFNITCTSNGDCRTSGSYMMTCQDVNVTSSGTVEKKCACDITRQFYPSARSGGCVFAAHLGELCSKDETTKCVDDGSECDYAGDLYNTLVCQCNINMMQVVHKGKKACATPISAIQDGECESCDLNLGKCYDIDGDGKRDGCKCPISLTGEDCEVVHVFVNCTVDDFQMTICYDPHDGVNFTSSSRMYTEDHGTTPACLGFRDVDGKCAQGSHRLELPLSEDRRITCGTRKHVSSTSIRYENRIFVDKGNGNPEDYILFKTYCLFQTHATASFTGIGVFALADGWAGTESEPDIQMSVQNALGAASTTAIRVGDKVRFVINLDPSGDYGAVRVDSCIFSPSYRREINSALSQRILSKSCPVGTSYLNSENNWHLPDPRKPYRLATGLVAPPNMKGGEATFLHCTVKVCLRGEIENCGPIVCDEGRVTEHQSFGRKRRNARMRIKRDLHDIPGQSRYIELSQGIEFGEGEDSSPVGKRTPMFIKENDGDYIVLNMTSFAIVTTVVLILLMSFLIISTVLIIREIKRSRSKDNVQSAGRGSPLYHLPRLA